MTMRERPAWAGALRELRQRHLLSQEQMAEQLDVDRTTLGRWERGRNRPQPNQVASICRIFAVSAEQLCFVDSEAMKRRVFAQGLLGVGIMAAVKPLDLGLEAAERVGLTALIPAESTSGRRPVEHFLLVRKTLADNDNLFGPQQVIPAAIGQVQAMQRVRLTLRGADLRGLLQVQTQFADLLGWLHQDIGDFRTSQYWMDRALEWAHLAGDHDSVVFVLARKSQLAGDMLDPVEAVDVAEAAMQLAQPGSRLGAVAATYAAHGHALRGDRATSDRLYDQAWTLLERAENAASPWGRFFDSAYIGVQQARSLAILGDHRQAADGFRSAIDDLQPGYHRDRGVYLAREAVAHAGAGEFEHAAALGAEALGIGMETNSGRIVIELVGLNDALEPGSSGPEVARFREALVVARGRHGR
jgi:transcriptional regulator with XRE-family HTH domain